MAELGLIPFARVALQVTTTVLPPDRTRFSKHQFTQPQLLAMLGLASVPDSATLYRFLKRCRRTPSTAPWARWGNRKGKRRRRRGFPRCARNDREQQGGTERERSGVARAVRAFAADDTERSEEFDGDAETVLGMRLDANDAGQVLESEAAARRGREAGDDEVHALEVGGSPGAEVEAADGNVDGGTDFFEVGAEAVAGPGADGLRDGHAASAAAVVRP